MMNTIAATMEPKIAEIKKLKMEIEGLKELVEILEGEVKAAMGDDTELIAGPFKVTWKEVVSNRFDTASFKKDYPTIYSHFCKPSRSRPFKIS